MPFGNSVVGNPPETGCSANRSTPRKTPYLGHVDTDFVRRELKMPQEDLFARNCHADCRDHLVLGESPAVEQQVPAL